MQRAAYFLGPQDRHTRSKGRQTERREEREREPKSTVSSDLCSSFFPSSEIVSQIPSLSFFVSTKFFPFSLLKSSQLQQANCLIHFIYLGIESSRKKTALTQPAMLRNEFTNFILTQISIVNVYMASLMAMVHLTLCMHDERRTSGLSLSLSLSLSLPLIHMTLPLFVWPLVTSCPLVRISSTHTHTWT